MRRILPLATLVCCCLQAETAKERMDELLGVRLDAAQCYRVRDVFLEREELKVYLTDGHLIFAEPYRGRDVAALFVATEAADTAEILVIPPTTSERQSVARYSGETVLNERFTNAMMLFTDTTADELRASIERSSQSSPDAETGKRLADRWSTVLRNLLQGVSLRILTDMFAESPPEKGFFAAAIGGGRLGRFDAVVDPRLPQPVAVGQTTYRDQRRFYETWTQFEGRAFEGGKREKLKIGVELENYSIDTTLHPDLSMNVVAEADLVVQDAEQRAFVVQLSKNLTVTKLLIDSEPADYLQQGQATGPNRRGAATVFVVLPEQPNVGDRFRLHLEYEGSVISRAGNDVYMVESRDSWYPHAGPGYSHFELRFEWPAALDLAATGTLIESGEGDGVRTALYRTDKPARLAGFNLGRYVGATREVEGYEIETLANEQVEKGLEPRPRTRLVVMPPRAGPPGRRRRLAPTPAIPVVVPSPGVATPQPADRVEIVADQNADAFRFFLEKFGPPATTRVTISPIPGTFGQGFPGLVYASTLSFLNPSTPPLSDRPQHERIFYSELLLPHEISHQWWGNTVAVSDATDTWLMEALATYSALLYHEHRNGRAALDRELRRGLDGLLRHNDDGETIESAGPVVLGERLRSAKYPGAYRDIVYNKGAWIIHMLRGVLGDEAFFELLNEILETYPAKSVSTDAFRQAAARLAPGDYPDEGLRGFFEQWVYGTGVPTLSSDYDQRQAGAGYELTLRLRQSGAPEHFSVLTPIEIELEDGSRVKRLESADRFGDRVKIALKAKAARVAIDPENFLLAVKK